jgi:hypothetical protein
VTVLTTFSFPRVSRSSSYFNEHMPTYNQGRFVGFKAWLIVFNLAKTFHAIVFAFKMAAQNY